MLDILWRDTIAAKKCGTSELVGLGEALPGDLADFGWVFNDSCGQVTRLWHLSASPKEST